MFDRKCKLNVLKDGIVLYLTGINLIGYYPLIVGKNACMLIEITACNYDFMRRSNLKSEVIPNI